MNKKRWLQVIAGIIILVIFLKWINLVDSLYIILSANWFIFTIAMTTSVITQLLRSIRFYFLSKGIGVNVGFKKSVFAHFITSLVGVITPAKLGEGSKIFFFDNKKDLTFTFILEKIGDLSLQLLVGLMVIFTFKIYEDLFIVILVLFVVGVLMIFNLDKILNFILRKQEFEKGWFLNIFKKISKPNMLLFILFTILILININITVWFYAMSLGLSLNFILLLEIFTLANVLGALSGTPGGVGSTQIIFTFLLMTCLGLAESTSGALALLVMIGGYVIYTALTLVSYIFYKFFYSKKPEANATYSFKK